MLPHHNQREWWTPAQTDAFLSYRKCELIAKGLSPIQAAFKAEFEHDAYFTLRQHKLALQSQADTTNHAFRQILARFKPRLEP